MKRTVCLSLTLFVTVIQSQTFTVCPGETVTLTAINSSSLENPAYSMNPGGVTSLSSTFTVAPHTTTTYTLYVTGTNSNSAQVTTISQATVFTGAFQSIGFFPAPFSSGIYTLGCGTKSVQNVGMLGITPFPSTHSSYTLVLPTNSNSLPSGSFAPTGGFPVSAAGDYIYVVRTHPFECTFFYPLKVVMDTLTPGISLTLPQSPLTCSFPSFQAQAHTSLFAVTYQWVSTNTVISGPIITITTNSASPTPSVSETWTVTVTNLYSQCVSRTVTTILQNIYQPAVSIVAAKPDTLSCRVHSVILSHQSSTGIPPGTYPNSAPVTVAWSGSSIQPTLSGSTFTAVQAGVYTLVAVDQNNGCMSKATLPIYENQVHPAIQEPAAPINLCESKEVQVQAEVHSPHPDFTYSWSLPANSATSVISGSLLTTSSAGVYTLQVTDERNGCISLMTYTVAYCVNLPENYSGRDFWIMRGIDGSTFIVRFSSGGFARLSLYDLSLKPIINAHAANGDCFELPEATGVYVLFIQLDDKTHVFKMMR